MDSGSLTSLVRTLIIILTSSVIANGLQHFIERPHNVSVIKGQTAVLRCAVENRVGSIQWAKNGLMLGYDRSIPGFRRYSIIGNSRQEFNLQIVDANLDDDTKYQCQVSPAENEPPLLAEADLKVLVPPNMPEIVDHPNGSIVYVAYSQPVLELKCIATNGRPAAVIKWFRDDIEITEDVVYAMEKIEGDKRENARSTLTLSPKYPQDNNARYVCQARNDALVTGPLKVMVTLSVQYPPGAPEITGYMRKQAVRTNDTVHMICTSVGGNPLAQVIWYRDNQRLDSSYKQRGNQATNELTLTAQRSDNDAQFRCEAWNVVNQDSPLVATRKLVVHFPPKSVTITGTREAKAGETLTLTCTTSNSNPAATINWIPQGSSIGDERNRTEPSPDGGFIRISEIDVTLMPQITSAIYTCSATNNQLGITVADTATVGVLYPPDAPQIFGYTEGDSVRAGDLLRMTCSATGGNPPATLTWYKGDEILPAKNTTLGNNIPSFELTVILKADDNGALYKCTASNKATDTPRKSVKKVTVHFPPAYVRITSNPTRARAGTKLQLTCITASSNPAAVITWIHKDITIQGTDRSMTNGDNGGKSSTNILEIIPSYSDHNAVYGCQAKNLALQEMIHDAITLDVLFKPVFEGLDALIAIDQYQSRIVNLTANANPPNATYVLKRDNVILESGTFTLVDGVLTISAISKDDSGFYTIQATNTEGTTSFNFTIDVLYPAEIIESTPGDGLLGETVELRCVARGNPMVHNMVTWARADFDMTRTFSTYENGVGTLRVEDLQKTDSGDFICTADNKIDTPAVLHIPLTVSFSPNIDKSREFMKAASETGKKGTLICRAEGSPSVTFQWEKDGQQIITDYVKYEIKQRVDPENSIWVESSLHVYQVQSSDYGVYQCVVINSKGTDRFPILFDDATKPDVPYDIEFINATHNSVTIVWKRGFHGGMDQWFRVRFKRLDMDTGYTQVDVEPANATIFTVKGLALGASYEFSVMAENELGGSGYQQTFLTARTSNLKPKSTDVSLDKDEGEDTPVIIILVVCIVGIFLLALNIGLILFFVRKRRKRMENGSDTTSHTNTIELYGPSKETALYPMTPSDESRSYGTCDKNDDDFSDDYKSYEHVRYHKHCPGDDCNCLKLGKTTSWKDNCCFDPGDEDIKRVFLPPPEYGSVTYSHNKMDSPTFDHRLPIHTEVKHPYNGSDRSDTDSCRKSPWQYDDPYRPTYRGKGTFDSDYMDNPPDTGASPSYYEHNGKAGGGKIDIRPKSITELSERSSRPSSRGGGYRTPPPPPVRSSSKGATENIPPLPARNYGSQDVEPRYVPPPGTLSSFNNNVNVITNPSYEGPSVRTPSPRQPTDPHDDMRGHLV